MNNVILIDLEFKDDLQEQAYRAAKAKLDPSWHLNLAQQAIVGENWFPAVFHFACLVKNDSNGAEFCDDLQSAYQELVARLEKEGRALNLFLSSDIKASLDYSTKTK